MAGARCLARVFGTSREQADGHRESGDGTCDASEQGGRSETHKEAPDVAEI